MLISGLFGPRTVRGEILCAAVTMMLFLGALACVSTVGATEKQSLPDKPLPRAEVDLNGDGKSEKITFAVNRKESKFVITVAGSSQTGKFEDWDDPPEGFTIIDIDKNDQYKEILVKCWAASDAHLHYIFAYDGRSLKKIGRLTRVVEFSGDGIVRVQEWGGFWVLHDKYVLDRPKHTLKKVPQEFYYVGVTAIVKNPFPVYASRNNKTVVAYVRPKSSVIILLCAPFRERPEWYILKTETGLIGWVKEEIFPEHLDGIPWAG